MTFQQRGRKVKLPLVQCRLVHSLSTFPLPDGRPKELTQKWIVTVGEGDATPALVGDKLYVFSREQGNEVTRALNAAASPQVDGDREDGDRAGRPGVRVPVDRQRPCSGHEGATPAAARPVPESAS